MTQTIHGITIKIMIGIVDVGGGMRGAYGAGVLDCFLEKDFKADYCIGVSAGSANLSSYLAGQKGRNYVFYTDYSFRRNYMSLYNFLHDHNYVDLDYIYSVLSNQDGEYPLDFEKIIASKIPLEIVATDALEGKPHYFQLNDMSINQYDAIKASCAVPIADEPYFINNIPYYDGGITDPIPFHKAFEYGCDKVIIILTRPKSFRRNPKKDELTTKLLSKKYPNASKAMALRASTYNRQLDEACKLEEEGKVIIVSPDSIGHMKTLTKDKNEIRNLYLKGYRDALEKCFHQAV